MVQSAMSCRPPSMSEVAAVSTALTTMSVMTRPACRGASVRTFVGRPGGGTIAGVGMPWFPDFVAAAEMVRRDLRTSGQADPVAQYLMALTEGNPHELETAWPGHIVVQDPYAGEVRGHRHLRDFVRASHAFLADRLVDAERVASTSSGSRAAVEVVAHLKLDGEPVTWPVAVVAESTDDQSVTFRTYGSQWPVVGRRPVRAPILESGHSAEPGGVVGRYLAAFGAGDTDEVVRTFTADGYLQEPIGPHALHRGPGELRDYFAASFGTGGGMDLECCSVTDDGVRCAVEFNCVRWGGQPVAAQAGLVVFERNGEGRLKSARFYDDVQAPVGR
jgi:SnoaL-like domain